MTSKGTFTLPARVRQALGVNDKGDKLMLTFHEKSGTVELTKGADLRAIQKELAEILKKKFPNGVPPLDMKKISEQRHQEAVRRYLDSVA